MTEPSHVTIRTRRASEAPGFTIVTAMVDGGDSGDYTIASSLVGTDAEVREILAQSQQRMESRDATRAGQD